MFYNSIFVLEQEKERLVKTAVGHPMPLHYRALKKTRYLPFLFFSFSAISCWADLNMLLLFSFSNFCIDSLFLLISKSP